MQNRFTTTYTGKRFHLFAPQIEDIDITDIAHQIGKMCRYGGATDRFYSVAEHSVRMSYLVSPPAALWALLHDAGEAYMPDFPSPYKEAAPAFVNAEIDVLGLVVERWGSKLTTSIQAEVHACDKWIAYDEAELMLAYGAINHWPPRPDFTPYQGSFLSPSPTLPTHVGWSPELAPRIFLDRFIVLSNKERAAA